MRGTPNGAAFITGLRSTGSFGEIKIFISNGPWLRLPGVLFQ